MRPAVTLLAQDEADMVPRGRGGPQRRPCLCAVFGATRRPPRCLAHKTQGRAPVNKAVRSYARCQEWPAQAYESSDNGDQPPHLSAHGLRAGPGSWRCGNPTGRWRGLAGSRGGRPGRGWPWVGGGGATSFLPNRKPKRPDMMVATHWGPGAAIRRSL